jgi:hypothetical protein
MIFLGEYMKKVEYFKINEYLDYILFVSNDDLYFSYEQIRSIVKENKKSILIDMFYRNGYSFNRFIELDFTDNSKVESRLVNPRDVSEDIKENTKKYFRNHSELLERSTLVESVKSFIQVSEIL